MAKAPVNKLVNGVNPFLKLPAELLTQRRLFPDAFNPRPLRDAGLEVARTLALEPAYRAIANLPSRGLEHDISTLGLYSVDPGEAAYNDLFTLRSQFLRRIGRERQHYGFSPQGNALYNMKSALRFGDQASAKRWLTAYQLRGGTAKGLETSLRNMHPLAGLTKEEAVGFVQQLTPDEQRTLVRALHYYQALLAGNPRQSAPAQQLFGAPLAPTGTTGR
jgi:hypothetical protein